MPPADGRLWTVEDLAAHLQTSPQAIYHMRHQGGGPRATRLGRSLRFDPADVTAWLEERKRIDEQEQADRRSA